MNGEDYIHETYDESYDFKCDGCGHYIVLGGSEECEPPDSVPCTEDGCSGVMKQVNISDN